MVELDCWESWGLWGARDILVTHGYTFTSACSLHDALMAVRDHAFDVSEYPVILTLENHCQLPMQVWYTLLLERVSE